MPAFRQGSVARMLRFGALDVRAAKRGEPIAATAIDSIPR